MVHGCSIKLCALHLTHYLSSFPPPSLLCSSSLLPLPLLLPSSLCTQNRQPFVTRDVVPWSDLAQALTSFFSCGTGRGLTQDNLRFLACKLIPNLGVSNETDRQTDRHAHALSSHLLLFLLPPLPTPLHPLSPLSSPSLPILSPLFTSPS